MNIWAWTSICIRSKYEESIYYAYHNWFSTNSNKHISTIKKKNKNLHMELYSSNILIGSKQNTRTNKKQRI